MVEDKKNNRSIGRVSNNISKRNDTPLAIIVAGLIIAMAILINVSIFEINGSYIVGSSSNISLKVINCDVDNLSECATISNNKLDVNLNDQTTPILIFPLHAIVNSGYSLNVNTVVDTRLLILNNVSGLAIGDIIGIFQDSTDVRNYFGEILNISGNNITLDTEFESVFDIAKNPIINEIETNINDDGSTNRVIHEFTNYGTVPIDITRVIHAMETTNAVDLNKFGDIVGGLEVGCLLREKKSDGTYANIYNFKTNRDFPATSFDYNTYDASHPNQGINGLASRLTFGSAGKLGVVMRLSFNESIQYVCHDNLNPLVSYTLMAEGSLTDEPQGS